MRLIIIFTLFYLANRSFYSALFLNFCVSILVKMKKKSVCEFSESILADLFFAEIFLFTILGCEPLEAWHFSWTLSEKEQRATVACKPHRALPSHQTQPMVPFPLMSYVLCFPGEKLFICPDVHLYLSTVQYSSDICDQQKKNILNPAEKYRIQINLFSGKSDVTN